MQEELKTKLKRTAKKLAAVGTGALVAGSTMVGAALAAGFTGLPAPFVTSGAFDAYVVIGTGATTITAETLKDVAGAAEVATAFGQLATTSTGAEGSATLQVEQFTGEALTAMFVNGLEAAKPTFHEDQTWATLTTADDLQALKDVTYTNADGVAINATINITVDDDFVELNRDGLAVHVNASTTTDKVILVQLDTNKTGVTTFNETDKLNWFGTLYEIVDIATDSNVTLGSTSSVTANVGETFTIGGQSFKLLDIFSTSSVYVEPVGGTATTVNSTYSTIGSIQLKVTEAQKGDVYKFAKFQTVENSYKFAVGDAWPLDHDFVVDSMTVNTAGAGIESPIVLRNNVTYDLASKGSKSNIAGSLDFIYNDNTADSTGTTSVELGGTGQINISETSGVTVSINASGTGGGFNPTSLNLPGVNFYTFPSGNPTLVTSVSANASQTVYLIDNSSNKYEARIDPNLAATGNVSFKLTAIIPSTMVYGSIGDPSTGGYWGGLRSLPDTDNVTTTSGVQIGVTYANNSNNSITMKVAAVTVTVDATTYYGRKAVSWATPVYSAYGAKVNWVSSGSTGTVSATEPNGQSLTVLTTFTSDNAVFNAKGDVKFNNIAITATGNSTGTDQATDHGSLIGYRDTATTPSTDINGTYVDTTILFATPRKDISIGIGALQTVPTVLDTDPATTTPVNATIGNTTITLSSGSGSSVSISKVAPGFTKLDSEISTTTLTKPVILMGGSGINSLVKTLRDGGLYDPTDLTTQGTAHAKVAIVENAFNSQTALIIAGYSGSDTLMASRAVAGALLNGQPFSFASQSASSLILNTGTSVVSEVSVMS